MRTIIPIITLPIEDDGFHLLIRAKVNSKEVNLILDTGASRTVFDEERIIILIGHNNLEKQERLSAGIGTTSMASKKVVIDQLSFNGLLLTNYEAAVLDLKHVNQSYEKLQLAPVEGILGGDILVKYKATINYDTQELILKG
ncbi:MAG: clan AA aspartic protease [Vicingus serpentipes]|nr:clan AA aspartic protease [Vicingus serpentipes]